MDDVFVSTGKKGGHHLVIYVFCSEKAVEGGIWIDVS